MDRPKRIVKVKSAPILIVKIRPKKLKKNNKKGLLKCKGKMGNKIAKAKITLKATVKDEKAQETQESGPSDPVESSSTKIAIPPKLDSQPPIPQILSKKQLKKLDKLFQRRYREHLFGKRKDQTSFTVFNSIQTYFL